MKERVVIRSVVAGRALPSITRGVATMAGRLLVPRIDAWWFRQV